VFVERENYENDYDFNRQWYQKWTEETYPECFELSDSDSYDLRNAETLSEEPADPSSTTYPENKVIKLSKITIEFDATNKRFCITDENGNYFRFNADDTSIKSVKDLFIGALNNITMQAMKELSIQTEETLSIESTTKDVSIKSSTDMLLDSGGATEVKSSNGIELKTGVAPSTEPMLLAQSYLNYFTQFWTWASTHIHSHPMGPTLIPTPTPPTFVATPYLSTTNKNN
jgi:hypothetical protein